MDITRILQRIGIGVEQAKIYDFLLRNGPMNLSEISKNTSLHRPRLYKILPVMQEIGLVIISAQKKRRLYKAQSPELLLDLFESTRNDLENWLAYMKDLYFRKSSSPHISLLNGKKFSLSVFDDVLRSLWENEIHYRYSSRPKAQDDEAYNIRRSIWENKQIQLVTITNEKQYKNKSQSLNHDTRMIPSHFDLFEDNISKVIYHDKVAIIDYNSETSFIIEDLKFAEFEKKIFKLLYSYLK
jgi:sugar-specific transcriptional regulator TrmB